MVNDHLSDFVARIKNGYMARKKMIEIPKTRVVEKTAEVLVEEGYISKLKKSQEGKWEVELKYKGKRPALTGIKRVSKPGVRVYSSIKDLPRVWGGLGTNILSTPKGIMSQKQAKKLNCGGEVLAQVW